MNPLFIGFFLLLGLGVWLLFRRGNNSDSGLKELKQEIQREIQDHHLLVSAALQQCQSEHSDAVQALTWLAGSDGTVSKQELRLIFRFCEDQGTPIDKTAFVAIDSLNSGMSMQIKATETNAHDAIKALQVKPASYRIAFFATSNKICGTNKRLSQTKERFLKQAESILQ